MSFIKRSVVQPIAALLVASILAGSSTDSLQATTLTFYEGNDYSQGTLCSFAIEPGMKVDFKNDNFGCPNDEARSMTVNDIDNFYIVRLYDNSNCLANDDWTEIRVVGGPLGTNSGIGTLEPGLQWPPGVLQSTYHPENGGNGLDGKLSCVEVVDSGVAEVSLYEGGGGTEDELCRFGVHLPLGLQSQQFNVSALGCPNDEARSMRLRNFPKDYEVRIFDSPYCTNDDDWAGLKFNDVYEHYLHGSFHITGIGSRGDAEYHYCNGLDGKVSCIQIGQNLAPLGDPFCSSCRLGVPDATGTTGSPVAVPVELDSRGVAVTGVSFSVDFDESCLSFDPTDSDLNGVPEAVLLNVPPGFDATVEVDLLDVDGEIDIGIADPSGNAILPDGSLVQLVFTPTCTPAPGGRTLAPVAFSSSPDVAFTALGGASVPGGAHGGWIEARRDDVEFGDTAPWPSTVEPVARPEHFELLGGGGERGLEGTYEPGQAEGATGYDDSSAVVLAVPETVSAGGLMCVCGEFPSPEQLGHLTLDDEPLGQPITETGCSKGAYYRLPDDLVPGRHRVGGRHTRATVDTEVLEVEASMDQKKLWKGQGTQLYLSVAGASREQCLTLRNSSPGELRVEGGDEQTVCVPPGESATRNVRGLKKGRFSLDWELLTAPCPCADSLPEVPENRAGTG